MKKYKLLKNETIKFEGKTLYGIQALMDFGDIKKDQKGGYVQSENNLSHEGDCWIYDRAKAMDDSRVLGNAMMFDNSSIRDYSSMHNHASMHDYASMYELASIHDNTSMYDFALMHDNTKMQDHATMYNHTSMHDFASMRDNASMYGCASIHDYASMYDRASMYDNASMRDCASIHDCSRMHGDSIMYGDSRMHCDSRMHGRSMLFNGVCLRSIIKDTVLKSNNDFIEFDCIGKRKRTIIYLKKERLININNCFIGNVDELESAVLKKYKRKKTNYHDMIKIIRALEQEQ